MTFTPPPKENTRGSFSVLGLELSLTSDTRSYQLDIIHISVMGLLLLRETPPYTPPLPPPPLQLELFDECWSPDTCNASLPALPSPAPPHQSVISAGGCTAPVNREPSPIFSPSPLKRSSVTFYLRLRPDGRPLSQKAGVTLIGLRMQQGRWRDRYFICKFGYSRHGSSGGVGGGLDHVWADAFSRLSLYARRVRCVSNLHLSGCRRLRRTAGHRGACVWRTRLERKGRTIQWTGKNRKHWQASFFLSFFSPEGLINLKYYSFSFNSNLMFDT